MILWTSERSHSLVLTELLLIDFSEAFDMAEHDIPVDKLQHYGIRGTALQWFKSNLSDKIQFVTIDGIDPGVKHMKYGVPQRSLFFI